MNKSRRAAIERIKSQLEDLTGAIEALTEEEQDAYDNLPPSFQEGERGESMQEAIDSLEQASSSVSEAADALEEAAK